MISLVILMMLIILGILFQHINLFPQMALLENLHLLKLQMIILIYFHYLAHLF
ncbi:hypothetical protein C2G38_2074231 [Gigaspora rosea]|uniref:Uncharacterized protein n=1 Tax=Gigaspora rosea TaxID=44941 RepID=A0A397VK98_9GLOM|nr:hypothetical protein C2G38_2074231 [Gigaspora rosea]